MKLLPDVSLKPYNTFGIDAKARYFSVFNSLEQLNELEQTPKLILGGGSNILLTKDVDGLVLKNEVSGIEKIAEDDNYVYVRAGAGENWHGFVLYCLAQSLAGVENLALIPGSVGASPMQNIGAYGVEIKDVFHELAAFHINEKTLVHFSADDCAFGYRESVFKNRYKNQFIILSVTYRLKKKPVYNTTYGAIRQELEKMVVQELSIQSIAQAVINIRTSKLPDPNQVGNAGSFFKNPQVSTTHYEDIRSKYPDVVAFPINETITKLAAGWLIEQCGWKGYRKGDAGCYPKQALVLVNYGQAEGREIYDLSERIIDSVYEKFGVKLEREVNIL